MNISSIFCNERSEKYFAEKRALYVLAQGGVGNEILVFPAFTVPQFAGGGVIGNMVALGRNLSVAFKWRRVFKCTGNAVVKMDSVIAVYFPRRHQYAEGIGFIRFLGRNLFTIHQAEGLHVAQLQ